MNVSDHRYSMNHRVVLVSERDSLAMEWELHQVRWLMGSVLLHAQTVAEAPTPLLAEDDPAVRWGYDRQAIIDWNQRKAAAWLTAPADIKAMCNEHADERQWWSQNKSTATLNQLRHAVRAMMTKAGGASAGAIDPAMLTIDSPESPARVRPMRWLMNVRNSIAVRRLLTAQVYFIVEESVANNWRENAYEHLRSGGEFSVKVREMVHFGQSDYIDTLDTAALADLTQHRERVAAASGLTGRQLQPGFIDLNRMGAGDTQA